MSHGLSGICENPRGVEPYSVLLKNSSCSQQVHPFATSPTTLRFLPLPQPPSWRIQELTLAKRSTKNISLSHPILPHLYPKIILQVSPIFKVCPIWYKRNGSILHAEATLQLFYAPDGTISFVVLGWKVFNITRHWPTTTHTTTTESMF